MGCGRTWEKFGSRADLQFRTTPGHLRMFFKKLKKEDEGACQSMEFEHGLGRLLMEENQIVLVEMPFERVGGHDADVVDDASGLPPLQLYHRYDDMGDRLFVGGLRHQYRGLDRMPATFTRYSRV